MEKADGRTVAGGARERALSKRTVAGGIICTKCKSVRERGHFLTQASGSVGSHCRACRAGYARDREARFATERAEIRLVKAKMKRDLLLSVPMTCARCGETKARAEWPVDRNSPCGGYPGKPRKYCCSSSRRTDSEALADMAAGSKVCTTCDERKPLSSFSPHKGARDGRQGTCRSCRSAKAHSGEWRSGTRRRDLIAERSDGSVTADLVKSLFSVKVCPCCDGTMRRDDKVLDHIVPLKLGGDHTRANVTVMCWSCNSQKAAHHPVRWLRLLNDRAACRMRAHYGAMGLVFDE